MGNQPLQLLRDAPSGHTAVASSATVYHAPLDDGKICQQGTLLRLAKLVEGLLFQLPDALATYAQEVTNGSPRPR